MFSIRDHALRPLQPQPNLSPAGRGLQHLPYDVKQRISDFCDVEQRVALSRVTSAFRSIVTPKLLLQPPSLALNFDIPRHFPLELLFDRKLWSPAGLKVMAFNWECGGHVPLIGDLKKSLVDYSKPCDWSYPQDDHGSWRFLSPRVLRNHIGWAYHSEIPAKVFGLAFYFAARNKGGVPFSMSALLKQSIDDDDNDDKKYNNRLAVIAAVEESGSSQARRVMGKMYRNDVLSEIIAEFLEDKNPREKIQKILPDWEEIIAEALENSEIAIELFTVTAGGLCPLESFDLLLGFAKSKTFFESSAHWLEDERLLMEYHYVDESDSCSIPEDYYKSGLTTYFLNRLIVNEALDLEAFRQILTLGWKSPREMESLNYWLSRYVSNTRNAELVMGRVDPYLDLVRIFVSGGLEQKIETL